MTRHYLNNRGFYKLAQSIKDYINRKITGYAKLGTASTKDFTTYVSPTQTEQLPISSSVYSAMTNMLRGAYHPAGSKTITELTSDLLVKANLGNVYKITEDGVTSNLFIGGAGQTIKTGDNAIVLYASEDTYKFSLESGVVDLDAYQKKELTQAIEGANTVEDALVALSNSKVSTDLVPSNASTSNKLVSASTLSAWRGVNKTSKAWIFRRTGMASGCAFFADVFGNTYLLSSGDQAKRFTVRQIGAVANSDLNATYWIGDNITYVSAITYSLTLIAVFGSLNYEGRDENTSAPSGTTALTLSTSIPTSSVTSGSTAPITSGGVYTEFSKRMCRVVINTSTDLNTLTTVEGVYYFSGGVTMSNAPVTQPFGILEVIKVGTSVIVQRYWDFIAGDMWLRRNTAQVFTAWVKFTHTA